MTCASRSSPHWRRPWSAAGSASRSVDAPPAATDAASSPLAGTRRLRRRGPGQQLGDGRRDGLCSSATRLGRSARRVTGRSRCWAAAARRRPIAWSLGRSVADDLGAQQPRHLGAVPARRSSLSIPRARSAARRPRWPPGAHDRHGDDAFEQGFRLLCRVAETFCAPGLADPPTRPLRPGEIRMRAPVSGISHGTELGLYRGTSQIRRANSDPRGRGPSRCPGRTGRGVPPQPAVADRLHRPRGPAPAHRPVEPAPGDGHRTRLLSTDRITIDGLLGRRIGGQLIGGRFAAHPANY